MSALIARARDLINDPASGTPVWTDDQIQDVLDAGRIDYKYLHLQPAFAASAGRLEYLEYYAPVGDWETDYIFNQWYTTTVTPSDSEPISGHFTFATNTLPPVFISGKSYDLYKSAADLLERQAAQWLQAYAINASGQSLQRNQVYKAMLELARSYRGQGRARTLPLGGRPQSRVKPSLRPIPIDYGV
jgi:hypothetical protein